MKSYYRIDAKPAASPEAVIQGDHYRFTVLTPWLMRLEYSETGKFEDRATQCVEPGVSRARIPGAGRGEFFKNYHGGYSSSV